MGRFPEYDEDAVLSGAMHAFRRQGYGGASIRDLEKATGLKAGSIYNSFGSKEGLFAAAFAHYNRVVLQRRIERHAPSEAGLDGLRQLFLSLLNERDKESFGCLVTNAAVELGGRDRSHGCVDEGLRTLKMTFAQRVQAARDEGLLGTGADANVVAVKLLALYQGILVLIRAGFNKAALRRVINQEFDDLEV
jgi:TetR/AcrR family transcriptional repressor of nem operon